VRKYLTLTVLFLFFYAFPACGQMIVGAGYGAPAPISVAPGQIATLVVSGLNIPQGVRAPAGPLPLTLGGVSATLRQISDQPVPIVEVRPISTCPGASQPAQAPACATLAAVTVQIPYELIPQCPLCLSPISVFPAEVFISVNGQPGTAIELNPLADEVHVLTACDMMNTPFSAPPPKNITGLPCSPMVTHADGSLVSSASPAAVGEELTMWAVGLGQTNPPAATGKPLLSAAPTAQTFSMHFNYSVNALPTKPYTGQPDVKPPQPLFSGLAAGFPGLYQINFVVPPQPTQGIPRCAATVAAPTVASNLTVSVGGAYSFDGAGICVATQIPVD